MSGIYIHIPFCRQACHYCNFHFSVNRRLLPEMVEAIQTEMDRKLGVQNRPATETIYLGGGTPSLLSYRQLTDLIDRIRKHTRVVPDAEITLEANPEDITPAHLQEWRNAGINRLSIGIQSFNDNDLLRLNRNHTGVMAEEAVLSAASFGFDNISIDLIYGIQGSGSDDWKKNIDKALLLPVQHISAYALTVEPKTAMEVRIRRGQDEHPSETAMVEQFYLLLQMLEDGGYEQYETSNFCRPGHISRHNTSYWEGKPYLGFGPSAHSYDPPVRSWNLSNNTLYIQQVRAHMPEAASEVLTMEQQANEYIMLQLRMRKGLDLSAFRLRFGSPLYDQLQQNAVHSIQTGQLVHSGNILCISKPSLMLADGIIAGLFVEDQGLSGGEAGI